MAKVSKNIYLHIGLHKTASTTLQNFLKNNKNVLFKFGYLYPESGMVYSGNHNLAWHLSEDKRYRTQYGSWDDLHTEIAATSVDNIILSSEDFEILKPPKIKLLKSELKPDHVKVIVYIRRQDALIQSVYAQQVKGGSKVKFEDFIKKATNFQSKTSHRFQFDIHLHPWVKQFGLENIIIQPLEKSQLYQEDICLDFLKNIQFPVSILRQDESDDFKWYCQTQTSHTDELIVPQNKNESPSHQALEIMRFTSQVIDQKNDKNNLGSERYLKSILKYYQNHPSEQNKFNQLTRQEALNILNLFEESNSNVARQYLSRKDGKLFYEDPKELEVTQFDISEISPDQQLEIILILLHDIWNKIDKIYRDVETLKSNQLNNR
jgi:hypothetical protein